MHTDPHMRSTMVVLSLVLELILPISFAANQPHSLAHPSLLRQPLCSPQKVMGDTYDRIKEHQAVEARIELAETLFEMESAMPISFRSSWTGCLPARFRAMFGCFIRKDHGLCPTWCTLLTRADGRDSGGWGGRMAAIKKEIGALEKRLKREMGGQEERLMKRLDDLFQAGPRDYTSHQHHLQDDGTTYMDNDHHHSESSDTTTVARRVAHSSRSADQGKTVASPVGGGVVGGWNASVEEEMKLGEGIQDEVKRGGRSGPRGNWRDKPSPKRRACPEGKEVTMMDEKDDDFGDKQQMYGSKRHHSEDHAQQHDFDSDDDEELRDTDRSHSFCVKMVHRVAAELRNPQSKEEGKGPEFQ